MSPAAEPDPTWRGWLSYIAEASDLLAGILDEQRVAALLAQLVVPRLALWCAVYTGDEATGPTCVWHTDEELMDALRDRLAAVAPNGAIPDTLFTPSTGAF